MKTVTEELEDFVDASNAVDIVEDGAQTEPTTDAADIEDGTSE